MTEAWLIVFAGSPDWPEVVRHALTKVRFSSPEAHHVFFRELEGERWGLLLVHVTATERDALVRSLERRWDFGFVNAVQDVTEG